MTVTDRTTEPDADFAARLASVESRPACQEGWEQRVERAARAMWAAQYDVSDDNLSGETPAGFLRLARTALSADAGQAGGGEDEPTSVDQLTREHFNWWVEVPSRQVAGYLYAVHDNFNDGYPGRTLVLIDEDGSEAEEEFTDSNPAGYPQTMRTPCFAQSDRPVVGTGQLPLDGSR